MLCNNVLLALSYLLFMIKCAVFCACYYFVVEEYCWVTLRWVLLLYLRNIAQPQGKGNLDLFWLTSATENIKIMEGDRKYFTNDNNFKRQS